MTKQSGEQRANAIVNGAFYVAGAVILTLMGWGVWHVYDDLASPVLRLKKAQWECTISRTQKSTVIDGKWATPRVSTFTTCDQYSRIAQRLQVR